MSQIQLTEGFRFCDIDHITLILFRTFSVLFKIILTVHRQDFLSIFDISLIYIDLSKQWSRAFFLSQV